MKILESVRGLAFMGSFDQARAFAAACAERTSGVLFWSTSQSGREADLEVFRQALELLWETGPVDPATAAETHRKVTECPEFGESREDSPVVPLSRIAARVLLVGVAMLIDEGPDGAVESSSFAQEFALVLGRRGDADLLTGEDEAQNKDVATVLSWEEASPERLRSLRAAAAERGRSYLAAAVSAYGSGGNGSGGSASAASAGLRVTATLDRGDVSEANARARFGVVGRIVSGEETGRYVRADLLVDLAETPEEREEAAGVSILAADDPDMEINCIGEWVEDWAGVEDSFRRQGWQVEWDEQSR
ncbi:hypothetical protein PUR57_37165 [Streptomyces sp. JV176]|uniref:hypothetical protein n=1 Tax=Streptomyces sp. JV176 TaxID=858630 RepID=UPI002E77E3C7|nr:hypothetical protein [Streptomyces sp. JV176]MEE1804245.1 hypothetical protein [Streptomyces sp. JV176]